MKSQLLILSIGILLSSCGGEVEKDGQELVSLPNVRSAEVIQDDFFHWVELQGTIESPNDVMLTPQVGGTIRKIAVVEGQKVRKGQLIAYMDNSVIGSNISEAEAALDNALYNYDKQKELNEAGVGTEFNFRQSYDQVKIAEKRINSLKAQAGKAAVFAPFNGVIDEIYPSEGEVGGPGMPICHLIGLEKLTITAQVSESFLDKLNTETKVRVNLPAIDTTLTGLTIDRISKYINPTNRTFKIFIDIDNFSDRVVPNMIARVQINDGQITNALLVDDASIQYDKNGNTFLFKLNSISDSSFSTSLVNINRVNSYGGKTVVESKELSKNDRIILEGAEGIQDKDTVQLLK